MTEKQTTSDNDRNRSQINRRRFIAGAGAAALSFTVLKPEPVRGNCLFAA